MKKMLAALFASLTLFGLTHAKADGNTVYTLTDETGALLTSYSGECDVGDEYISSENRHYRITAIDHERFSAVAEFLGDAEMPDVSWLDMQASLPVSAIGARKIAIYCTHSDESYIEGDGTQSVDGAGGIYDIAALLAEQFQKKGISVQTSDATHLPHDAGAYRRSRQTAVALLKDAPDAIFDLHRDGIPDPKEYETSIGGEEMSKVRLLVGKSNQNREANLSFAKQIKAVGDKIYPGLIKDIYIGKGTYNQDLAPRSVLLEFGTHTLPKELVKKTTVPMSEVIVKAMYGGITGSAGASDVSPRRSTPESSESQPPASKDNTGAGWSVWIIAGLVAGIGLFALVSTGGKGAGERFKRTFSEMTGGLFGKKPNGRKD